MKKSVGTVLVCIVGWTRREIREKKIIGMLGKTIVLGGYGKGKEKMEEIKREVHRQTRIEKKWTLEKEVMDYKWIERLGKKMYIGMDRLSWVMVMMTSMIGVIGIRTRRKGSRNIIIATMITELMFMTIDVWNFYIWYEGVVWPMYIIIGEYGGKKRQKASKKMMWYTVIGGTLILIGIGGMYVETGTLSWDIMKYVEIRRERSKIVSKAIIIGSMWKVPMWPYHTWLPIAHATAPTEGSLLLAGVLIKAGVYSMYRWSSILRTGFEYWEPMVRATALITILYTSMTTIREVDIKKVVAYSSIGHMGLAVLGLIENEKTGTVIVMISHGFVSTGFFICIHFLYGRYKTRLIRAYTGLLETMPIYGTWWLVLSLCNIGYPLSGNFVGEYMILVSLYKTSLYLTLITGLFLVYSTYYTLWLGWRLLGGRSCLSYRLDLKFCEYLTLLVVTFWIFGSWFFF